MISQNYIDYLMKSEIKTIDYLRILADLVSANNDTLNRIEKASTLANIIQARLAIPVQHEVAVGILAVLFCHSRLGGKVPFRRLRLKMGLLDLLHPLVVEDFIFLLNNKYIKLEKSVDNIEYIQITSRLYKQIWKNMTEENERLFMMVAGKTLTDGQLKFFKSKLFNVDLDVAELFKTAVVCKQFEAAKIILDFGYDQNRDDTMPFEIYLCLHLSKFCLDFYLENGLIITNELLDEVLTIALEHQGDFDFEYNETERLVEGLRQIIIKE